MADGMARVEIWVPPPLVDAPYVIGIDDQFVKHALAREDVLRDKAEQPDRRIPIVRTMCSRVAELVTKWGAFEHGNMYLDQGRCPVCGWAVAVAQDAVEAELDALAPRAELMPAYKRALAEPLMAVRICEAIIARTNPESPNFNGYELDDPHTVMLLGHASAHAPVLLVPEGCAEGDCDHWPEEEWDNPNWTCPLPEVSVGCGVCSARAGKYAGEWEGQFAVECTVEAPCSVLRTFSRRYRVKIGTRKGRR